MNRYFTKTFQRFLFAFMIIIAIAFGLLVAGSFALEARSVDNTATAR